VSEPAPTFVFPNVPDAPEEAVTVAVASELAGADEPPAFDAVTCARSFAPTSPATTRYDDADAEPIGTHDAPAVSHRSH
jgi:hypothetical protein